MHYFAKSFPVGSNYFAPLDLQPEQLDELRAQAREALNSALAERCQLHASENNFRLTTRCAWRVDAEFESLTARFDDFAPSGSLACVRGTIEGNYKAIARLFKCVTREQYFNTEKTLYPDTLDAAVLFDVPQRENGSNVSEGIRWAVHRSSWRQSFTEKYVFESTGIGMAADGQPYFYCVTIPTTLADATEGAPIITSSRAQCRSVIIMSPLQQDVARSNVFATMRTDSCDYRTSRRLNKRFIKALTNVGKAASRTRSPIFVLRKNKWVLQDLQRLCEICSSEFSLLRTKHQCSVCAEAVCRNCLVKSKHSSSWLMQNPRATLQGIKVCKPCFKRLRQDDLEPGPVSERTPGKAADLEPITSAGTTTETLHMVDKASAVDDDQNQPHRLSESVYSISPGGTVVEHDINEFSEEDEDEFADHSEQILTVDTRDMKPVWSVPRFETVPSTSSPVLLHSIRSSLREQAILLRQLQHAALGSSVQRNTEHEL